MSIPAENSDSTLRNYSNQPQALTTYRKRGPRRISPSQRRLLECLRSLPQELLNMIFRYMFLNNPAPDILYKLGMLRMCRYTGIVEALRESIDIYTTIRVGRRNRSKELLSQHWDTLGRLEHLTMTVLAVGESLVKADDIRFEFQKLLSLINVNTLRSLYFTTWSNLDQKNSDTLSEFLSSAKALRNLLLPSTSYVHPRAANIGVCLEYDDKTHVWTHAGADLGLAKTFLHRFESRQLRSITLFGAVRPGINIAQAQDVHQLFELMGIAEQDAMAHLKELFALNVDLAEVLKYVPIGHLKHLFIWDCDHVADALMQCNSVSLPMEKLHWAHTGSGTSIGSGRWWTKSDANGALAFFAKLTNLKRLRIWFRSPVYLDPLRDNLHEWLSADLESASMTTHDSHNPRFGKRDYRETWAFQHKNLKGINLILGGVTQVFIRRHAAEVTHIKAVIEEHAVTYPFNKRIMPPNISQKSLSGCKNLEILGLSGTQQTIQEQKGRSGEVIGAYQDTAQYAAKTFSKAGLHPNIISMHIRFDRKVDVLGVRILDDPWHFRVKYYQGKDPVLDTLEPASLTEHETELLFDLGLCNSRFVHSLLMRQAPMVPWKGSFKDHWATRWLSEFRGM
jgi:hypothetical protein